MRAALSPTLASRLVSVAQLTTEDRTSMFGLLDLHFEGVTERRFQLDLAEKNWALLLDRPDGSLAGFTTLRIDRAVDTPLNESVGLVDVVTSGDTLVAPDAWSSSNLAPSWIAAVRSLAQERPIYWLLIVSGWRTYRFLPVFWRRFIPRCEASAGPDLLETLRQLARARFGAAFDEEAGVVRFDQPQRLRGELAGIPDARRRNPHVDFFAHRNPGHGDGDELVCLTEISDDNLTPAGRRMVARGQALNAQG